MHEFAQYAWFAPIKPSAEWVDVTTSGKVRLNDVYVDLKFKPKLLKSSMFSYKVTCNR